MKRPTTSAIAVAVLACLAFAKPAAADPAEASFEDLGGHVIAVQVEDDAQMVSTEDGVVVSDTAEPVTFDLPAGAELQAVDGGVLAVQGGDLLFVVTPTSGELTIEGSAVVPDGVTTLAASTLLISKVTKVKSTKGTTYQVYPTTAGRLASWAAHAAFGWGDIKGMGVPDQIKYKHQYLCHIDSQVARVKPSWNLESWRPNVGYPATLAAGCNP